NDTDQIRQLFSTCLPTPDAPLRDWQAVVIGGGIINGITQAGGWPGERIADILKDDSRMNQRWWRLLEQASAMADDDKVPAGTRYDALRIVGMDTWERRGRQLAKYLARG